MSPANRTQNCSFSIDARTGASLAWPEARTQAQIPTEEDTPVKGYCMKCRDERTIADAKEVRMKNGRPATEGKCPVCGTRMYRLGKIS